MSEVPAPESPPPPAKSPPVTPTHDPLLDRPVELNIRDDEHFDEVAAHVKALLEKAAAKLHGSYEALAGGTFAEAFHTLTGFPVDQERLHGYTRDGGAWAAAARARGAGAGADDGAVFREAFDKRFPGGADEAEVECFARVFSFFESGFAVGASTFTDPATPFGQEMKAKGLQTRHAYGLLECRVYDGEHLFKLRNPNGVALWKGKWSREDAERMTFAARKALGLDREDPGVFWMAVDDFLAYFVELTVCRVLRDRVVRPFLALFILAWGLRLF